MTEYRLCRAKIESSRLALDVNRYLCRIIPDMEDITETELLPDYPFFLKTKQEILTVSDIVWCLVSDDFQLGYILGLCENPLGRPVTDILTEINKIEAEFNLPISEFSDINFSIEGRVYLDFSNKKTLINGRLNYAGSLVVYSSDGSIFLKALSSQFSMNKDGTNSFTSKKETHTVDGDYTIEAIKSTENIVQKVENVTYNKIEKVGGIKSVSVLGSYEEAFVKDASSTFLSKKKETIGQGEEKTIVLGGAMTTVMAGDYTVSVGIGSINLTSGAGVNINAGPTGLNILSAGPININGPIVTISTGMLTLSAPMMKTGIGVASGAPGPFCAIPVCPITGLPHTGNSFNGSP